MTNWSKNELNNWLVQCLVCKYGRLKDIYRTVFETHCLEDQQDWEFPMFADSRCATFKSAFEPEEKDD